MSTKGWVHDLPCAVKLHELMNHLANNEVDVDLLIGNQIISDHMGDNAPVVKMFNKLNQHIIVNKSSYHNICE